MSAQHRRCRYRSKAKPTAPTAETKMMNFEGRGAMTTRPKGRRPPLCTVCLLVYVILLGCCPIPTMAFHIPNPQEQPTSRSMLRQQSAPHPSRKFHSDKPSTTTTRTTIRTWAVSSRVPENCDEEFPNNVWELMAATILNFNTTTTDLDQVKRYYEFISALRVGLPALAWATGARLAYPSSAMMLATAIDDAGVFAVVSQDASQYIQNILTTSGLVFSLLAGQTYYFMYQQQEAIYLALFEEVTMAKSLLEQVSLVCQGRQGLYHEILSCIDDYVQEDLSRFNSVEPAELIAGRPMDDPLENILYLTSVGEPSIVYQTVRSLRQARAYRLGALQRKLPPIHMTLLYSLAAIVLFTFPLLGAGSQTIGGNGILIVQGWYLSFIVFGITLVMGVIEELQRPAEKGAYNAQTVLSVMICGLQEDLALRLEGKTLSSQAGPSVDADGFEGYRGPNE